MSELKLLRKESILSASGVDDIAYAVQLKNGYKLKIIVSTFSNCQIFTVGSLNCLFIPETAEAYSTVVSQLNEIRALCGINKRLCQIDVHQVIFDKIKDYCQVHCSMAYQNLTGSNMVSAIIKLV